MMNYQGYEELREDIGALANAMDELRQQIRDLERKYQDEPGLIHALTAQFARSVNKEFLDVYLRVLVFTDCFRD
ncbi:hypothetical protein ACIPMZ_17170 [Scandinavium goeteborgense]|uniref:hypothetical protein n=1 Tax=Scandinavium goeteborgense TaxID=1851514 RepID=UPI003808233F